VADLGILVDEISNPHGRLDATSQVKELPAHRNHESMPRPRGIPPARFDAPDAIGQGCKSNSADEMSCDVPVRAESKLLESE
jgi:hypothetical protein